MNMQMKQALSALAFTVAVGFSGAADAGLFSRLGGQAVYDDVLDITWLADANYAATELTDTRRDAIIAAVNSANPSWLIWPGIPNPYVLSANDFLKDASGNYTGQMTWFGAMAWADQLVYGGYEDWMLPTVGPVNGTSFNYGFSYDGSTDFGYNNTSPNAQLSYMYYVNLGLDGYYDTNGIYQSTWGIFGNGTCNGTNCSSFGQNNVGLINNLQAYVYWSGTEYAPHASFAWFFLALDGLQFALNLGLDATRGPCAPEMSAPPCPSRPVSRWSG